MHSKPKENPKLKRVCFRMDSDLHEQSKIEAIRCGVSLQKWISDLIEIQLK
jgi:predicted HicB family RNase H-like nuclease